MPEEKPSRPVSRRRRVFRFVRRLGLLLLLTVVVAAVYLNQIGLPGFLKDRLLASLRERGVQAEFKRLHWQWPQSVVAEGLLLRRTGDRPGPEFSSASAGVRFDWSGWFPPRGRVESMVIHNGAFSWVLTGTNQTPPLRIDSINAELAVSVDETLDLRYFSSRFHQLNLSVGGVLANPRALGHPDARPRPPANLERLNQTMTQVANYLTNLSFTAEPELKLRFTADATDWESLRADLDISAPETRTTWGSARDFRLLAKVHPPSATNPSPAGVILLSGSSVDTPWGRLENWQAETLTVPVVRPHLR